MIDVKTAKTCLLTEMASRLAADGFRALPREQVFRLAKPFGCWLVHLTFIPHRGVDLDVTASVAIRVDAVEELGNEHRNDLSAKYAKWTATLGAGLDNLSDVATGRWTMVSVNEAASVAEKICTEVRSIGYPFLE